MNWVILIESLQLIVLIFIAWVKFRQLIEMRKDV